MEGLGLSVVDDLKGRFYSHPYQVDGAVYWDPVENIREACGLMFLCPTCFTCNEGMVGTHRVMCWSTDVSQDWEPNPGRWEITGTGLQDVSLTGGSASVAILGECGAHFWITHGKVSDRKIGG